MTNGTVVTVYGTIQSGSTVKPDETLVTDPLQFHANLDPECLSSYDYKVKFLLI